LAIATRIADGGVERSSVAARLAGGCALKMATASKPDSYPSMRRTSLQHSMSPQCNHRSRWCASCRVLLRNLRQRGSIRIAVGLEALKLPKRAE
jgi:hypothetical protein